MYLVSYNDYAVCSGSSVGLISERVLLGTLQIAKEVEYLHRIAKEVEYSAQDDYRKWSSCTG